MKIFPVAKFAGLLAACVIVFALPAFASPLQDGIEAYAAGDYPKAMRSFQLALDQSGPSEHLYFNLGLAAWKAGELPKAVVSFLRAIALNPSQREAVSALAEISSTKGVALPPTTQLIATARQIGVGTLWVLGSASAWAAILFFLLATFRPARRALLIPLGVLLLLAGVGCLSTAYVADPLISQKNLAVVDSAKPMPARNNPVETAGAIESLSPGSVVSVLSRRGNWTYCTLPSGKKGWLLSDSLIPVLL